MIKLSKSKLLRLKLKNKYFIDLQNRYSLTPAEEREWKRVSKKLFDNNLVKFVKK